MHGDCAEERGTTTVATNQRHRTHNPETEWAHMCARTSTVVGLSRSTVAAVQRNNGRVFLSLSWHYQCYGIHVRKPLRTRREPRSPPEICTVVEPNSFSVAIRLGRGSRQFLAEEGVEQQTRCALSCFGFQPDGWPCRLLRGHKS